MSITDEGYLQGIFILTKLFNLAYVRIINMSFTLNIHIVGMNIKNVIAGNKRKYCEHAQHFGYYIFYHNP